jgi:hypothetical protein
MGFVTSSSTIQLYAYLTQYARERILNGDITEFQAKYFSLHDEDVNYLISKYTIGQDSSGNTLYNVLKTGFVPDITGDPDSCIKSMVSGVLNKNMLTNLVSLPSYLISPDKTLVNENETVTFTITTQNVSDNTTLYWANAGTTNASDFIQNVNNGTVTIISNTATFTLNIKNDSIPDSDETIVIQLKDQSGNVLATADTVIVKDIALTPITAEYIFNCLQDNSGQVTIGILSPNGGSGGPYTWKAWPYDSFGNLINLYGPDPYAYKASNQTYVFPTVVNGTNAYYRIYVKDSAGNENLIHTSTNVCQTSVGTLILKVEPSVVNIGASVGSYQSGNNFISQSPSQFFSFIATLTKSNNTAVLASERNVSFKLQKDLNFDNHVDITQSQGASFPTNTFNFTNGVANAGDTVISLNISFKVDRNTNGLNKPASNSFAQQQPIGGNGVKVKITNVVGGVTTQNDTLTINANKWVWI